jgi:hypothetical protein
VFVEFYADCCDVYHNHNQSITKLYLVESEVSDAWQYRGQQQYRSVTKAVLFCLPCSQPLARESFNRVIMPVLLTLAPSGRVTRAGLEITLGAALSISAACHRAKALMTVDVYDRKRVVATLPLIPSR